MAEAANLSDGDSAVSMSPTIYTHILLLHVQCTYPFIVCVLVCFMCALAELTLLQNMRVISYRLSISFGPVLTLIDTEAFMHSHTCEYLFCSMIGIVIAVTYLYLHDKVFSQI